MSTPIRFTCVFVLFLSIIFSEKYSYADQTTFTLATASKGGTYYPVGEALATLTKVMLQPKENISITAIVTAGSEENIQLLRENKAQFAILQGLYGYYALNGIGPIANDGPQKELRSISMLWQQVEQFIVASEKIKTTTISDIVELKGAKVSFGKMNSGTLGENIFLLKNLNIDASNTFDFVYAGYGESIDLIRNGKIQAISLPAGVPTTAVSYAFRLMGDKLAMLNFTPEQAKQADGGLGLWTPYRIPAGTYPGLEKDVMTIAQTNFLVVRADVDDKAVYNITKLIFENLRFLQNIHKATLEMSTEKALEGLLIPLHPGAAKYFKEIGVKIPANLIVK
ncbi:MAG: TAXI family TRAP transporter solute-binding subunit [Pseudomonadota bacterium]